MIRKGILPILVFVLLLAVLTIADVSEPERTFSVQENRMLAVRPAFGVGPVREGTYMKEYESYVNDQFFRRDAWISLKVQLERLVLKKKIKGIIFGDDGYFVEVKDSTEVDYELVEKNIQRLSEFVVKYKELLGNDRVFACIVPTAASVLENRLPDYFSDTLQINRLEELDDKLGNNHINLTDMLKGHSDEYIFYKTDHHWTTLGAYYAYLKISDKFGMDPFPMEEFNIGTVSKDFYGTLQSKLNIEMEADEITVFDYPGEYKVTYNDNYDMEGNPIEPKNDLYAYDKLETKDKYAFFLRGNNALTEIETGIKNGRRLLVAKDSFAHCLVPFLVNHYEKVYMIDYRYYNIPLSECITKYGITDMLALYNAYGFMEEKTIYQLTR